jgi:5-methylcytosine-specific restriction enzyme subunit McrC
VPVQRKHITVFEHQAIRVNQIIDGVKFDEPKLKALQKYYGEKGVPYFSLIHNGVKFNEFVGVIQVDNTVIEVLPKADNRFAGSDEKNHWRDILIDMIFAVGVFDIHAPSSSSLKIKSNSILDLYFELFINETEYLLHSGLVKQYRKREGNVTALKGNLKFAQHIQQNLTHQERFYVSHTTYDYEHKMHIILYKTIRLLTQINTNAALHSRLGALMLNFPEMPDMNVSESTFSKLVFDRKTQRYKKAIEIARLILLQYHPDVSRGRNYVLALMFDMNKLWEQFVYISLRKHKANDVTITAQTSKYFWKPQSGYRSKIRPDIVVNKDKENCMVLDTKWKNLKGYNPSSDDLRQMYVYHEYYDANKVALVYPGEKTSKTGGKFLDPKTSSETVMECNVISIGVESKIKEWQYQIGKDFNRLLQFPLKENTQ